MKLLIPLVALLLMTVASANPAEKFNGTWVAWAPSSNSFEGQFRQVVNVGDQSSKIGRLLPIIRDNKVIGAAIPESSYSEVKLTRDAESGGYTAFKCVLNENSYVMVFRGDEMMLFDSKTKSMINFFKRQDIKSPEFLRMLESTDGAADLMEGLLKVELHQQVKDAMENGKVMEFQAKDGLRKIRFVSADSQIQRRIEPLHFGISKVITRAAYPDVLEVSLDEAGKYYAQYAAAAVAAGHKPELEFFISKDTDDHLLRQLIEVTCPIGENSVWISYFEGQSGSAPNRLIQKPIAPENQINPVLKDANQQPVKPIESK